MRRPRRFRRVIRRRPQIRKRGRRPRRRFNARRRRMVQHFKWLSVTAQVETGTTPGSQVVLPTLSNFLSSTEFSGLSAFWNKLRIKKFIISFVPNTNVNQITSTADASIPAVTSCIYYDDELAAGAFNPRRNPTAKLHAWNRRFTRTVYPKVRVPYATVSNPGATLVGPAPATNWMFRKMPYVDITGDATIQADALLANYGGVILNWSGGAKHQVYDVTIRALIDFRMQ